jgi:tetratricopeptide (TPR) repeat protein
MAAYREALAACQQAIQIRADNPASYFFWWGKALAGIGPPNEDVSAWIQAVQGGAEKNADVANTVAWFLATDPQRPVQNPELAVRLARKAVDLEPLNGGFWNTLGVAYYRAGQWQETVAALKKAMYLRSGGDSGDGFFLAMAQWQLGDTTEARGRAIRDGWESRWSPTSSGSPHDLIQDHDWKPRDAAITYVVGEEQHTAHRRASGGVQGIGGAERRNRSPQTSRFA